MVPEGKCISQYTLGNYPKMEVWQIIFLFKVMIFRFQVNFPGSTVCDVNKLQLCPELAEKLGFFCISWCGYVH